MARNGDIMTNKNDYMSIGEVARYTGVGVDSLRYYEKIGLLEPAFIDPQTKYRYYTFAQIHLIEVITLCIELDIPLKELTQYISEGDTLNYAELLAHGREIAEKKLKSLQKGLKFIRDIEKKIARAEKNPQDGTIYTRKFPQKYFCVTPCKEILPNAEPSEIIKKSLNLYYYEDNFEEFLYSELLEYGFLCKQVDGKTEYFMFAELPQPIAPIATVESMIIPSGKYFCRQSADSQIQRSAEIFAKQLKKSTDSCADFLGFLAIETKIFTSRYKINSPAHELRIICL